MPDFSQLLRKPAGVAKKPPALPAGDYSGIIKSWEVGDNNKNKTPYVRFNLVLTAPPDDVELEPGTDLSKKPLRRDYYLTDDALWRLDDFIRSCGIEPNEEVYEEVMPQMVGLPVTVEVQQYINQSTSEIGNQVGKLTGG
jgi:hypothetical protein